VKQGSSGPNRRAEIQKQHVEHGKHKRKKVERFAGDPTFRVIAG